MLQEIVLALGMSFADSAPNNTKHSALQPKAIALTFYRNSSGSLAVTGQCGIRYDSSPAVQLLDRISKQKVEYYPSKYVKQVVPKQ